MVGIAFVGAGMVAELHRDAIAGLADARLVGVHDTDRDRCAARAAAWACRAYGDLDALLADPEVEAVYVLSPAETHVPIALRCLAAGRHAFVEKPVSFDPVEIDALADAARRGGLVAMPGHNYAYTPEFGRLARLVRSGDLGTIRAGWITYAIEHREEVAAAYGGVLDEVMVHHAYLALALLGAPDRVHAGIADPAWERHTAADQAWMTWDYGRSATMHLFASFAVGDESADPWTFVVKLLGTCGSAAMTWRSSVVRRARGSLDVGLPVYEESYRDESRAFLDAILHGSPLVSSLADAAMASRIVRAAHDSAATRASVLRRTEGIVRW